VLVVIIQEGHEETGGFAVGADDVLFHDLALLISTVLGAKGVDTSKHFPLCQDE